MASIEALAARSRVRGAACGHDAVACSVRSAHSRAAADRLVGETIGPLAGELGLPLPEITELEVHNSLSA